MFPSECKTQREVHNTTWTTKYNGRYKTQREVQTFDYDNKEVIDLDDYVTSYMPVSS